MDYLITRNGTYCFRLRIPRDLLLFFPHSEFKRSLRTKDFKHAKLLSKSLSFEADRVFTIIRGNMLSTEQIKKLTATFLANVLREDEEQRTTDRYDDLEDVRNTIETFEMVHSDAIEDFVCNRTEKVAEIADELLTESGLKVEKDSLAYKKLCREILKTNVKYLEIAKERLRGNYENDPDGILTAVSHSMSAVQETNGKLLSEVITEYIKENQLKKSWRPKTEEGYLNNFKNFMDIIQVLSGKDNIKLKAISKELINGYIETLSKLPSNLSKDREYRDKPLREVLEALREKPCKRPMTTKTINKKIVLISSLFKWAQKQDYIDKNVCESMTIRETGRADKERAVYAKDDLQKLLASPIYTAKLNSTPPEQFFVPWIALYSGMRLEEICQLHIADIKEIDGVPCFDINEKEGKRVKSESGERIVPIHPELVQLGLLKYVEKLRGQHKKRLWENLPKKRDGYGTVLGKWFQRYNRRHITADPQKVFHSFRHNFTDNLKQNGVAESVIAELVGHSIESMTMGRYGKRYRVKVLLDAIKKLDYGIDLSHLKFPL